VKFSIKGFDQMSLVDWDGMVATTLYVSGCNFRCPYCHNSGLVLFPDEFTTVAVEQVLAYIHEHNDFLDGVVITGGEPLMHGDIGELASLIHEAGVDVKIDTNGSFPEHLERLIDEELVDYVAMDVKAPLDFDSYSRSAGIADRRMLERVRDSVDLLLEGRIDYEFRTTVVPALHRASDLELIAEQIKGARKFVIQNFVARDPIDPTFEEETSYNEERLDEFKELFRKSVDECIVRG
jgi:pyruvate formate lyase activating enzyme